ncbi:hypothetical protein KMW28_24420 [Flammeovirga yaeyamensis]|uniref:Tail specific protease domain-containing protein n=1 Tax=Flammeovirga yaeyamensis TaxID=367791 RepID=A0AAX1NCT1_9BACT|nr:S41 family peptidase [Flammeovirga yaeyamensis]MBB3699569.1 C-terminal processing protease CtpA/Prc [Flammeovirga yaeyamensis]NMF35176.1 hypothetical protein [Flammeovirga yaeyamensis]QWG04040.1 hypothetical protein KMW28_24420 [Flammeovirga yaeyamensis]
MKKLTQLSVLLITLFLIGCGNQSINKNQSLQTYIKLWGFLKYYHPEVAKGTQDWDSVFIARLDSVKNIQTKDQLNNYYSQWIKSLGNIEKCENCADDLPDSLKVNLDLSWINDSNVFSTEVMNQLNFIKDNRNQGENYYISQSSEVGNTIFSNEKKYEFEDQPSEGIRLLALARYWNIINYYFPYKYQTDDNWGDVLTELIPLFQSAQEALDYQLAVNQMVSKINDSHGYVIYDNRLLGQFFGKKYVPFRYKVFDNKAIVKGFFDKKLSNENDILFGDVILGVENQTIAERSNYISKYFSFSNNATLFREMEPFLTTRNKDSIDIKIDRKGEILNKRIALYPLDSMEFSFNNEKTVSKFLSDDVGYINMEILSEDQIGSIFKKFKNTKAIVFDLRNYPMNDYHDSLCFHLSEKEVEFAKFSVPNMKYPGTFKISESVKIGMDNPDYYKGKKIVLCNESTQSASEFMTMFFQALPNTITVGSQTAGADGDVSEIPLPGGITALMSGIGVFYPNGEKTQRTGVKIDVYVEPTIEGISEERDEVLEKAINLI